MNKAWFLPITLILLAAPAPAQAQFSYTTNSDGVTVTITGYTGSSGGAVSIPASTSGLTVNNIGIDAFENKISLTSVTIPGSVTNIGFSAFYGCTGLTNATLSNGVFNIGDVAFLGCTSLTSVTIPASVTNIGASAFDDCPSLQCVTIPEGVASIGEDAFAGTGLTNVTIPASVTSLGLGAFSFCSALTAINADTNNSAYSAVNGVLFDLSQSTLVAYPGGGAGSYTIPGGVATIGGYSFQGCPSLTGVTISGSVTNIGDYAFSYCTNLAAAAISGSVISIGSQAFFRDYLLTNAALPASVTSLGADAFGYCTALSNITVDAGNPAYVSVNGVLFDATQSTLVEYPGRRVGSYSVPVSVTNIEDYAFDGCSSLTNVTISNGVAGIGSYAFNNCMKLTNTALPASVTILGANAFANCTPLKNVYFLGNAPVLGSGVFTSDNNTTVYYYAGAAGWGSTFGGRPAVSIPPFNYTTNAGEITITGYIGSLGNVVIPATINGHPVASIATNGFANLTNLTSITISGSVTNLGNSAFSGDSNLTSVCFNGNAPAVGTSVFASDNNATVYYFIGATGWGSSYAGLPAVQQIPNDQLGTTGLLIGPGAGSNSVVLAVDPRDTAWTATANASWLHLTAANQSGTGSTNVIFTDDANPGATRSGTLTIGWQTLTVTQAGLTYVSARPVTALVSTNLNGPWGVAVDGAGNVYIGDSGNNAIKEWTVANNTVATLVGSGLNNPTALAVDSAGNVFFDDTYNNAVKKWTAASGSVTTLLSNLWFSPYGVAVDGAGDVYIDDTGHNAIRELTPNGNLITLVSSGLSTASSGVAVDIAGNVYIADSFNVAIKKWTAANNSVTALVSGVNWPEGPAVDACGNVYWANRGTVMEWSAANNTVITLASSGLFTPSSVAVDGAGNVYIADSNNNGIKEVPYAFVDATPKSEGSAAGSDALPPVLPTTANLFAPFAPTSDQPWLTITGVASGVVSFSFTANPGPARTGHITLLGQSIAINQAGVTPPSLTRAQMLGNGVLQFAFTNIPGASFTILSTTNVSLPLTNWMAAGIASEISPGLFQFTSPPTPNDATRFYTVRAP